MAVVRSGAGSTDWTIDSASNAGRVTLYDSTGAIVSNTNPLGYVQKPLPYGSLGHYRQARRLALAASQAAGALWEFQWTNANVAVVTRVRLTAIQNGNATAEELRFSLKVARAFTAADTTNTASILPTGNLQKMRTAAMGTTLATAIRESNSATAAAGGTKTLDTDPIALGSFTSYATLPTTGSSTSSVVFDYQAGTGIDGEHPLVLTNTGGGEGWALSLDAAKGATTGVALILEHAWAEVASF